MKKNLILPEEQPKEIINTSNESSKMNDITSILNAALSGTGDLDQTLELAHYIIFNLDPKLKEELSEIFPYQFFYNLLESPPTFDIQLFALQILSELSDTKHFPSQMFINESFFELILKLSTTLNISMTNAAFKLIGDLIPQSPELLSYLYQNNFIDIVTGDYMTYDQLNLIAIICQYPPENITPLSNFIIDYLNSEHNNISTVLEAFLYLRQTVPQKVSVEPIIDLIPPYMLSYGTEIQVLCLKILNTMAEAPSYFFDTLVEILKDSYVQLVVQQICFAFDNFLSSWGNITDFDFLRILVSKVGIFSFQVDCSIARTVFSFADDGVLGEAKTAKLLLKVLPEESLGELNLKTLLRILEFCEGSEAYGLLVENVQEIYDFVENFSSAPNDELDGLVNEVLSFLEEKCN